MNKKFYTHNDKLYLVLKEVHEDKIKMTDLEEIYLTHSINASHI